MANCPPQKNGVAGATQAGAPLAGTCGQQARQPPHRGNRGGDPLANHRETHQAGASETTTLCAEPRPDKGNTPHEWDSMANHHETYPTGDNSGLDPMGGARWPPTTKPTRGTQLRPEPYGLDPLASHRETPQTGATQAKIAWAGTDGKQPRNLPGGRD